MKEKLEKAMKAKSSLESIATINFDKPKEHLKFLAKKYQINLENKNIKN